MIASELEKEFNVNFTMEEIESAKNVADIKKSLMKHGIKLVE